MHARSRIDNFAVAYSTLTHTQHTPSTIRCRSHIYINDSPLRSPHLLALPITLSLSLSISRQPHLQL